MPALQVRDFPATLYDELKEDVYKRQFYNRVMQVGPTGSYPNVERYNLPVQCQQCTHARCVEVCPTGAVSYTHLDVYKRQLHHIAVIVEA